MKKLCILLSIFFLLIRVVPVTAGWNITEKDRRKQNDKYDKKKLRQKTEFVVDVSKKMLSQPKEEKVVTDFTIAGTPPEIEMMIIFNIVLIAVASIVSVLFSLAIIRL